MGCINTAMGSVSPFKITTSVSGAKQVEQASSIKFGASWAVAELGSSNSGEGKFSDAV